MMRLVIWDTIAPILTSLYYSQQSSFARPRVLLNSMAPGRCGSKFKSVIFEHMLRIKFMNICEIVLRWTPQITFDDKSTLVQLMAWCRQAMSHYLSQGSVAIVCH